jgi:hypothetical protein
VITWHDWRPPEAELEKLSRELNTHVFWLAIQKQVDAFAYQHWRSGDCLRRITYGCYELERTWEQVDGISEAWEDEAFFSAEILQLQIKDNNRWRERGSWWAPTVEEDNELREIWQAKRLQVNQEEPRIGDTVSAARIVAKYHDLPGWDYD